MSMHGEKRIMIVRSALCAKYLGGKYLGAMGLGAICLAGLVGGGVAQAGTNDILIGIDNKITYGDRKSVV